MKCVLEEETNTSFCVHVCKNCSIHAEATTQTNKNHLTAVLVQHVDDFNDAILSPQPSENITMCKVRKLVAEIYIPTQSLTAELLHVGEKVWNFEGRVHE